VSDIPSSIRFGVWAPVHRPRAAYQDPAEPFDASWEHNSRLVLEAERLGHDSTLIAQHTMNPHRFTDDQLEAWISAGRARRADASHRNHFVSYGYLRAVARQRCRAVLCRGYSATANQIFRKILRIYLTLAVTWFISAESLVDWRNEDLSCAFSVYVLPAWGFC
jgi:hypothetical protein